MQAGWLHVICWLRLSPGQAWRPNPRILFHDRDYTLPGDRVQQPCHAKRSNWLENPTTMDSRAPFSLMPCSQAHNQS